MSHPLQILMVEDSKRDAELIIYELRRAQFDPQCHCVQTELDYLIKLRPELDVIISDFSMPKFNGLHALELMKSRGYEIPFILISGTLSEEVAVRAIKLGATDFITKDRIDRLGPAVRNALEQAQTRHDRKAAEKVHLQGEQKFRALFNAAQDAIYMLHNGVFVDCNSKGLFMYGRTWDQIVGHTPDEFAPLHQPDGRNSREKAIEIVHRALAGEAQCFEWTACHADGIEVCSEVSLNRIEMGGEVYLMAISRDVTERKRAEDQIMEQATLLDIAQDAISVRDLEGNITFWNKGAERMYGWNREEVIGRNIHQLVYRDPGIFKLANRLVIEQGEWAGEVRHFTKDQRELVIEARWTLLRDKHGQPKSVLAINTDITEKKEMETHLMHSQRLESIGTLAGGIAHDLNNILTPILTSIEMLKHSEANPRKRRILETIEANSRRGADIVRQVLTFARGVSGDRIEIQPKRLLKDIETLIEDTFPKNIYLALSLPDGACPLLGDPTQLHQILLNLCMNARDAMPQGGTLGITVKNTLVNEQSASKLFRAEPGRYVNINVSDTGVGIPSSIKDKIFEPFFTTKEIGKGAGLGLSTVISIVKSHGGFIEVDSEIGQGAVFKVYLPAMETKEESGDDLAMLDTLPHGHGETVLIVDDEASIREVTCDTLQSFGYRTLSARDGAEAVAIYQQKRHEISVVLTDMTMPIMDGVATIAALHLINPDLKIITSSGFKTKSTVQEESLAAAKYFLPKPYLADALLKIVRDVLNDSLVCAAAVD